MSAEHTSESLPGIRPDWEGRRWCGAAALREERGRERRRLRVTGLVVAAFLYCLLQVHLSNQVAARGSRLSALESQLKKMEVDLTVAKSRLASRQVFGELMTPARQSGFGPGGQHRVIALLTPKTNAPAGLADQFAGELQRGTRLLMPAALAQEVWADGRGRTHRP